MYVFSNPKSKFGYILEGLAKEYADTYVYGHLINFTAIWYTYFVAILDVLRSFGINICLVLVCFTEKYLATLALHLCVLKRRGKIT
jgi:hypothetical protein